VIMQGEHFELKTKLTQNVREGGTKEEKSSINNFPRKVEVHGPSQGPEKGKRKRGEK